MSEAIAIPLDNTQDDPTHRAALWTAIPMELPTACCAKARVECFRGAGGSSAARDPMKKLPVLISQAALAIAETPTPATGLPSHTYRKFKGT